MDRSVIADVPRERYVERCKQRAFDYLARGDLKSAVSSFINNMMPAPIVGCRITWWSLASCFG